MKRIFSFFLALLWFGTANHCFVVDAFAKPAQPVHRCCDESQKSQGPHHPESDKACCQQFVAGSSASPHLSVPGFHIVSMILPIFDLCERLAFEPNRLFSVIPFAAGPPGKLKQTLRSLTLAPNAPPFSL